MLKNIVFIIIMAAFAVLAALQFASQLEIVSATHARRNNGTRRSLELGRVGRIVIALVFFALMFVLGLLSRFTLLSQILAIIVGLGLVAANVYLKGNGIHVFPALFFLWGGLMIASQKDANLMIGDAWGTIYNIIMTVLFILLCLVTIIGNINAKRRELRKERRDADELEEQVEEALSDDDDDSDEDDSETDDDESETDATNEDDTDDDPWHGEDPFNEKLLMNIIKVAGIVILLLGAVALGYWLETSFDFFPPYNI